MGNDVRKFLELEYRVVTSMLKRFPGVIGNLVTATSVHLSLVLEMIHWTEILRRAVRGRKECMGMQ